MRVVEKLIIGWYCLGGLIVDTLIIYSAILLLLNDFYLSWYKPIEVTKAGVVFFFYFCSLGYL